MGKQRDELRRLFNLCQDLLCVAGTDGYFKQINPAFEAVLGYPREELLSRSFLEFVHPDDRESTQREVETLASGLPAVDFVNRYRASNGDYRWLAWRATPAPRDGLIYAVARDITQWKTAEAALATKTAELERSNRELEEFALVASHDLQAPLRAIANLSEWLEEDMPGELPPAVKENLKRLRGQVQRMERMTEDLLTYARAGRRDAAPIQLDIAELAIDVADVLQLPPQFKLNTEADMPVFETVRAPLEQVFRNLIENAVKHHDRGEGTISISCQARGDFLEFVVEDDGPGIPAAVQQEVFSMFERAESKCWVKGSGMGLSLVKRLVETYGGRIWVESKGRGTAVHFTWPKAVSQQAPG